MPLPILLGSSSVYRKSLLEKLQLPFICASPNIDESSLPNESGDQLALRLAIAKAAALSITFDSHLIIGSDQVCTCDGKIYGKPLTTERAQSQLREFSGRKVTFYTGICLINSNTGNIQKDCDSYSIHFRTLSDKEITQYISIEQPLDCAGSIKSEGLGITLIERFEGQDPNTLIGLPLIKLITMLKREGYNPLAPRHSSSCGK